MYPAVSQSIDTVPQSQQGLVNVCTFSEPARLEISEKDMLDKTNLQKNGVLKWHKLH